VESEEHAPVSQALPGMADLGVVQSLNLLPGSSMGVPAASSCSASNGEKREGRRVETARSADQQLSNPSGSASKDEVYLPDPASLASPVDTSAVRNDKAAGEEMPEPMGASGERVVAYEDGSSYTGHLVDGIREGYGSWKSSSASYEGTWLRGRQNGHGKQTWTDGRSYEGQFCEGQFHGQGLMTWITLQGHMTYEGDYRNDVKHGQGRFMWPDGRVYDGCWIDGQRSGNGSYVNLRGEVRGGVWVDDRFERWLDSDELGESQVDEASRI